MILRGNCKSSHSVLNLAALDKAICKDIDHGWSLPLTIESLQKIINTGVMPLGVAETLSINEKGGGAISKDASHMNAHSRASQDFS